MASLISVIRPLMFSYELQRIEISSASPVMVAFAVSGSDTLLSERYWPDRAGNITLYDLNVMAEDYIGAAPSASFQLLLDGSAAATFTVIRSSVAYDTTAAAFVASRFLVSSDGTRITARGRYECLSFYADTVSPVTVAVKTYNSALGALGGGTVTLRAADYQTGTIVTVDVSPRRIETLYFGKLAESDIYEYTVCCGARRQKYRVEPAVPCDPAIIYRNRFNVWDTYYFPGTKYSEPKFDRAQMWMTGRYITYRITEEMIFKATTAPVSLGLEACLEDIARSPEVRLLDSTGAARDLITVMDCDIKAANDDNALNVFTISYRHADKISAKSFTGERARIFDNSFDDSYE